MSQTGGQAQPVDTAVVLSKVGRILADCQSTNWAMSQDYYGYICRACDHVKQHGSDIDRQNFINQITQVCNNASSTLYSQNYYNIYFYYTGQEFPTQDLVMESSSLSYSAQAA